MRVAGIVLAAGAGRRFGGPTKQAALVGGRPLVARAVEAACASRQLDEVVVVVGSQADEVRAVLRSSLGTSLGQTLGQGPGHPLRCGSGRHRIVHCGGWAEGIAASLRRGLEEVGDVDAALVLLADQPLVTAELVALVLREGLPGLGVRHEVARPFHERIPGHPVLLGRSAIQRARTLQGDRGLGPVIARRRMRAIPVDGVGATLDVDQPADLVAAERAFAIGA
ncbi:MAG: nucleotidyltransferase family protein [Solirubrobacteraceae bacterium]|nr:nucleotidyltransferase family protein [Solirubrobacteraceae bacterium]